MDFDDEAGKLAKVIAKPRYIDINDVYDAVAGKIAELVAKGEIEPQDRESMKKALFESTCKKLKAEGIELRC